MIEKLYTVEEVAELASVTGRTIRNYLKSGRLIGRKIGGQWRFPEAEVQRLLVGGDHSEDLYEEASDVQDPISSDDYHTENFSVHVTSPESSSSVSSYVAAPAAPVSSAPSYQEAPSSPVQTTPSHTSNYTQTFSQFPTYEQPPVQQHGSYSGHVDMPYYPHPASSTMQPSSHPQFPGHFSYSHTPINTFAEPSLYPTQPYIPAVFGAPALSSQYSYLHGIAGEMIPPLQQNSHVNAPAQVPPASTPSPEDAAEPSNVKSVSQPETDANAPTDPLLQLSDVGKRVSQFVSEVHDCSGGPSICTVVDLNQSIQDAQYTSDQLSALADEESAFGSLCQSFVEFDERYFIARYTLFGTMPFILRAMKVLRQGN